MVTAPLIPHMSQIFPPSATNDSFIVDSRRFSLFQMVYFSPAEMAALAHFIAFCASLPLIWGDISGVADEQAFDTELSLVASAERFRRAYQAQEIFLLAMRSCHWALRACSDEFMSMRRRIPLYSPLSPKDNAHTPVITQHSILSISIRRVWWAAGFRGQPFETHDRSWIWEGLQHETRAFLSVIVRFVMPRAYFLSSLRVLVHARVLLDSDDYFTEASPSSFYQTRLLLLQGYVYLSILRRWRLELFCRRFWAIWLSTAMPLISRRSLWHLSLPKIIYTLKYFSIYYALF